jgi:hypothetical protein
VPQVEEEEFQALGADAPYLPGNTYYGRNEYVRYDVGDLPIILSAPHGGKIKPLEIYDRTYGVTVTDYNTRELTETITAVFQSVFGARPHVIINNLSRYKLDANRDVVEAAQGNIYAVRAWEEYHHYIASAKSSIEAQFGYGLFLDIHGHGANPDGYYDMRTWLGYLLTGDELDKSDADINNSIYQDISSIKTLTEVSPEDFVQVLRGPNSLGSLLNEAYSTLPSTSYPGPEGMFYYSGGYNTHRHGSSEVGGAISAIQLEMPLPGIRENNSQWYDFGLALSAALETYFKVHYNMDLKQ